MRAASLSAKAAPVRRPPASRGKPEPMVIPELPEAMKAAMRFGFAFDVINSFAGMSSIRQSPAWRPYWRRGDARTGLDSGPIARRRVQSLIARLHCLVARSILWPRLARWQASRRIHGWGRQTCRSACGACREAHAGAVQRANNRALTIPVAPPARRAFLQSREGPPSPPSLEAFRSCRFVSGGSGPRRLAGGDRRPVDRVRSQPCAVACSR
jgi:hypothetical protein